MRLIVLGPPGAGKGTQIANLVKHINVKSISTGDLLRENIRNNTEVGQVAQGYMNEGKLVPDKIIYELVENFIGSLDSGEGFILDGFPRNLAQAETLEDILKSHEMSLDQAVYIDVQDDEIIKRLSGRLTCSECGKVYHITNNPPKKEGICDDCGSKLIIRDDDKEEAIKNRLEVYKEETEPLISYYEKKNILYTLDGTGNPEEISKRIVRDLGEI